MGEEARGLAQKKESALNGKIWSFLMNFLTGNISGFTFLYLILSLLPGRFTLGNCFLVHVFSLSVLTDPCQTLCSNVFLSETYLFAGHCLDACAPLQVEKDLSETPDGYSKVDVDAVHKKERG